MIHPSQLQQTLSELSNFRNQNIPRESDKHTRQYFEAHAKALRTMLDKDSSLQLQVTSEVKDMVKHIINNRSSESEKMLELYMIEIETTLPDILSERFVASWLWSSDKSSKAFE